jgi:hypothetical protein
LILKSRASRGIPIANEAQWDLVDLLKSQASETYRNDDSDSTECRNGVTHVAQPPSAVMLRLPLARHPDPVNERALISARVGVRDLVFGFS